MINYLVGVVVRGMRESSKFLETGLTPEYKEKFAEREPVLELQEDLELYTFVAENLRKKILDLKANAQNLKLKDEDFKVIDSIKEYLDGIEKSVETIAGQAELFETLDQKKPVKVIAIEQTKEKISRLFILMNGLENIGHKVTPPFAKAKEFEEALFGRKEKQFYERYFGEKIAKKERDLEKLTGMETALFNSGMAAIETVLQNEELRQGDVILVGENFYSQTKEILDEYEKKGIKVVRVDTGKTEDVIAAITKHQPKFLMLETIANAPRMEVADLDKIMEAVKKQNEENKEIKMRLIVDNTFLTPALNNLMERASKLWPQGVMPVIGVESATKYYQWGLDNINCGIVYSNDVEYMKKLKNLRARIGTNLQGKLASFLPELPRDLFERKMQRHSQNTLLLAKLLEKFPQKFSEVSYPGLESHRDYKAAKEYRGAGGVIYLICKEGINGEEIADKIKKFADQEEINLNIGGSFGHPETWCAALNRGTEKKPEWIIRIACGSENIGDFKKVMNIFDKALSE